MLKGCKPKPPPNRFITEGHPPCGESDSKNIKLFVRILLYLGVTTFFAYPMYSLWTLGPPTLEYNFAHFLYILIGGFVGHCLTIVGGIGLVSIVWEWSHDE